MTYSKLSRALVQLRVERGCAGLSGVNTYSSRVLTRFMGYTLLYFILHSLPFTVSSLIIWVVYLTLPLLLALLFRL